MSYRLHHGDCLDVMRTMPDNSIDSIVTDPPYGLRFMGRKWDYDVPSVEIWAECLRVLKPGGHLLAFGGSRTYHRMACAVEDAGFEIRDQIMWIYGSGFPKSLDVSKAIDKAAGAEREVVGSKAGLPGYREGEDAGNDVYGAGLGNGSAKCAITAAATNAARRWQGWGTALKPAHEPIVVARKPLVGTVAANVLAHGTGALNIDACRVETNGEDRSARYADGAPGGTTAPFQNRGIKSAPWTAPDGRWPANVIHDGSDEVLAGFPQTASNSGTLPHKAGVQGAAFGKYGAIWYHGITDSGSAARFFYCAKASPADRHAGCDGMPHANPHPTIKPTNLMRYLCRLVTPPGALVLDPFAGSGSTGRGALLEGFRFIGIEREAEFIPISDARLSHAAKQAEAA